MYLYLLVSVPFIISSIILYSKYKSMATKYELAIAELDKTLREGYYEGDIPLELSDIDGKVVSKHTYHYIVYIKEIDRYTNGECKVVLDRVEVTSGPDSNQYEHIKNVVKKRFCSVIPSNKVIWLEREETLKEQRRRKLEQLNELE